MNGLAGPLSRALVVGALAQSILVGCARPSRPPFGSSLHAAAAAIRGGDGHEKPRWSDRDWFTFYMQTLEHRCDGARMSAAVGLCSMFTKNAKYPGLLDAFIDYGPIGELERAVLRAWQRAEVHSEERYCMAAIFVELKGRRHLWAHPELAERMGVKRQPPPHRGWFPFGPDRFAQRLLAEGDEEFKMVWEDLQYHRKLAGPGKLKRPAWDYPIGDE